MGLKVTVRFPCYRIKLGSSRTEAVASLDKGIAYYRTKLGSSRTTTLCGMPTPATAPNLAAVALSSRVPKIRSAPATAKN